jgi:Sec-independent protein translocase protein TatA
VLGAALLELLKTKLAHELACCAEDYDQNSFLICVKKFLVIVVVVVVVIGMTDSKEFANELFDALVRRKSQQQDMMKLSHGQQQQQQQQQHCLHCISKEELYEYWLQITDKSFDSRMRIFFAL